MRGVQGGMDADGVFAAQGGTPASCHLRVQGSTAGLQACLVDVCGCPRPMTAAGGNWADVLGVTHGAGEGRLCSAAVT